MAAPDLYRHVFPVPNQWHERIHIAAESYGEAVALLREHVEKNLDSLPPWEQWKSPCTVTSTNLIHHPRAKGFMMLESGDTGFRA